MQRQCALECPNFNESCQLKLQPYEGDPGTLHNPLLGGSHGVAFMTLLCCEGTCTGKPHGTQ